MKLLNYILVGLSGMIGFAIFSMKVLPNFQPASDDGGGDEVGLASQAGVAEGEVKRVNLKKADLVSERNFSSAASRDRTVSDRKVSFASQAGGAKMNLVDAGSSDFEFERNSLSTAPENVVGSDREAGFVTKVRDRGVQDRKEAVSKDSVRFRGAMADVFADVARENLLRSQLPRPAVFMAVDPDVSGIPESAEPALLAEAEKAVEIIEDFHSATENLPQDSEEFYDEKVRAVRSLEDMDYSFRAKYGQAAWMAHQNALNFYNQGR